MNRYYCKKIALRAMGLGALRLPQPARLHAAWKGAWGSPGVQGRDLAVGSVEQGVTARAPKLPPVPQKPETEAETETEKAKDAERQRGKGFRYNRSREQKDTMIWALGAAVVITPVIGLAAKFRVDPEGFRKTMEDALPPAATMIRLAGAGAQPTTTPVAPASANTPLPRDPLALPPGLDKVIEEDVLADARSAVEKQRAAIAAAGEAVKERLVAEQRAEQVRRSEVEAQLAQELAALENEAAELQAENIAARQKLEARARRVEAPRVIFQEVRAADALREAMSEEEARGTAERIITHLVSRGAAGVRQALVDELPTEDEPALRPGAELTAVQARVTELLRELEARTRLELLRLREAVRHAEGEARERNMATMQAQLAAQERELQRLLDIQVAEINRATKEALADRQARYAEILCKEQDLVNQRGEEYAALVARIDRGEDLARATSPSSGRDEPTQQRHTPAYPVPSIFRPADNFGAGSSAGVGDGSVVGA